jgi:hypothetical protein
MKASEEIVEEESNRLRFFVVMYYLSCALGFDLVAFA